MEAGLDSLGTVDLRNALGEQFSVELPATLTFDYPTVSALAAFISSLLPQEGSQEADGGHVPSPPARNHAAAIR